MADELVVFSIVRESQCSKCETAIERGGFLRMKEGEPLCMKCAGLADMVYVPMGDAVLTRRAKKHSARFAVVVRWSRTRKRYEWQGILVEEAAFRKAEEECAADEEQRESRKPARETRAQVEDRRLLERMAERIRELFPGCPPEEARTIAEHAAERGSGRVGRSAAGRALDENALRLAVIASIRHNHTRYGELLLEGCDRDLARSEVADDVEKLLRLWETGLG